MIMLFKGNLSSATRASQMWQILIGKAHQRQTITYGNLAQMIGFGSALALRWPLGYIMCYCQQSNLPPLTVLVVNQGTTRPGKGLKEVDFSADCEAVFTFDWFAIIPPTLEELIIAYNNG